MYFGDTHLWLARSTDLVRWQLHPKPVLSPREGLFDSRLVEPGPPPLLTDEGILFDIQRRALARHALRRRGRRV